VFIAYATHSMVAADFCQVSIPSGYGFRESLVAVERANKDNSPEKRLAVASENAPLLMDADKRRRCLGLLFRNPRGNHRVLGIHHSTD
jgi:hypothetical protein